MTVFQRAAALAAFSIGVLGLGAISTPGNAVQAAGNAITGQAPLPQLTDLTFVREAPTVAATIATPPVASDRDDATELDTISPDQGEFQSLAAAVAGQTTPGDVSTELRCLAGAVYYEAKGEPLAGQLAVAEVIINRARSGRFPKSLCGVVVQAGQFSFVRGGAVPAINPALLQWRTALAVAQVALGQDWESPASDAMFFHARHVRPGWGKPRLASIGNHVFYR